MMADDLMNAIEYEEGTTITLDDTAAALVITPEEYLVYVPKMEDDDEVPLHVMLLTGVSVLLTNDEFVKGVLGVAFSKLGEIEDGQAP